MLKDLWKKEISRRKFLKASGLAAASSLVLTACNQPRKLLDGKLVAPGEVAVDTLAHTYAKENITKINTACYMCAINCAAVGVVTEDNIVKRVEPNPLDPVSGGSLCAKGNAGVAQMYDEDRLKYPMRKTATHTWEQISWDEAFDIMYEQFTRIANEYGPETVPRKE